MLYVTGVYAIRNTVNGKIYVGGAYKSFDHRWGIHIKYLRVGTHGNNHLQNAWNNYGESNFKFEVLHRCPADQVELHEQFWISHFQSTNREFGYNKSPTAGSPLGTKHPPEYGVAVAERNRNRSAETRYKLGASWRGKKKPRESVEKQAAKLRGKPRPPEVVAKIAAILKGKKRSPEAIARMTVANRKAAAARKLRRNSIENQ